MPRTSHAASTALCVQCRRRHAPLTVRHTPPLPNGLGGYCTRHFGQSTTPIRRRDSCECLPSRLPYFLAGSPSHLQPHRQALSSAWVRRKLPAAPATAILSIVVHFLQRWSFISSRTETHAGRSAHGTERHAHGSSPGRRETSSPAPQLPRASGPGRRAHQRREMKLC